MVFPIDNDRPVFSFVDTVNAFLTDEMMPSNNLFRNFDSLRRVGGKYNVWTSRRKKRAKGKRR